MAEEGEQQAAETTSPAPTPGKQDVNGAGKDAGAGDDLEALKAELDRERRAKGQLLNEKQQWTKGREERDALKKRLQEINDTLEEHDLDTDGLKEVLQSRTEAELGKARDKGQVDTLLANQAKKFERDIQKQADALKERDDLIVKHRATIDALTIDAQIMGELAKIVEPSLIDGAFALHRAKGHTVDDPEAPYGIRVVMDVAGDAWTPPDYFKNWAETDPKAQAYLIGNRSSGGGAPAGTGRGAGPRMQRSKMDARAKSDYITEYGIERYNALPW